MASTAAGQASSPSLSLRGFRGSYSRASGSNCCKATCSMLLRYRLVRARCFVLYAQAHKPVPGRALQPWQGAIGQSGKQRGKGRSVYLQA